MTQPNFRIIICFVLIILPLNQVFGTQDSDPPDATRSEAISCSLSFSYYYYLARTNPTTTDDERRTDDTTPDWDNYAEAQTTTVTGESQSYPGVDKESQQATTEDSTETQQSLLPLYEVIVMNITTNGMPHNYTRIRLNNVMMSHRSVDGCSGMRMMIMEDYFISCEESTTVQTDPSSTYYYFHHPETNATHHTIKVFGFTFLDGEYTYTENYAYTQLHRNLVLGSEVQCSSFSFIKGSIGKPIFTIMI